MEMLIPQQWSQSQTEVRLAKLDLLSVVSMSEVRFESCHLLVVEVSTECCGEEWSYRNLEKLAR